MRLIDTALEALPRSHLQALDRAVLRQCKGFATASLPIDREFPKIFSHNHLGGPLSDAVKLRETFVREASKTRQIRQRLEAGTEAQVEGGEPRQSA